MKLKQLGFLILLALTITACTNPKHTQYNNLKDQVIGVHDEVMPKMGDISKLISTLEKKSAIANPDQNKQINAIKKLQGAYDFMMRWMKEFGEKFELAADITTWDEAKLDRNITLMEAEVGIVEKLKTEINESIAEAEALLK